MANKEIVEDYKIVRGHPADVEGQVKRLLETGWQPYGEIMKLVVPVTNIEIIIQCMVLIRK